MPIKLIEEDAHGRMLKRLGSLPFGDRQATIYRKSMEELYRQYKKQLAELDDTIAAYHEVFVLAQQKQPLVNKKQYARVKRREMV